MLLPSNSNKQLSNTGHDKICMDFYDNGYKQQCNHIVDGCIHKQACSFCFQEVEKYCCQTSGLPKKKNK